MNASVLAISRTAARPPAQPVQLKASGSASMPAPMLELTRVKMEERAEAAGASSTTTCAMAGLHGRVSGGGSGGSGKQAAAGHRAAA